VQTEAPVAATQPVIVIAVQTGDDGMKNPVVHAVQI
jgi:hypothetical protein